MSISARGVNMSAQNAPAGAASVRPRGIEDAVSLLEEALAILDCCKAPAEDRARLDEIIDALKERSA